MNRLWQAILRAWRQLRWCRRGIHREGDWLLAGAFRSIYCLDCGKLLVLRRRELLDGAEQQWRREVGL